MRILNFILLCVFSISTAFSGSLEKAEALLKQGNASAAMSVVEDVLAKSPGMPEARFLKGLVLVEQGQSRQAIKVFTSLTRDYPELPEPYNNLAVIYASEGDYDRARDALQSALKTHPSYSTAYENLGDIYAKLASEAYQQALDLEENGADGLRVKLALIDEMFVSGTEPVDIASVEPEKQPAVVAQSEGRAKVPPVAMRVVAEPVVSTPNQDAMQEIMAFVDDWSSAWSSQDVELYLSFYAPSFRPAAGSLAKWRMQRHIRLKKPDYIQVTLSDMSLSEVNAEHVRVDFTQQYESSTYADSDRKRLDIIKVGGEWKIFREKSI